MVNIGRTVQIQVCKLAMAITFAFIVGCGSGRGNQGSLPPGLRLPGGVIGGGQDAPLGAGLSAEEYALVATDEVALPDAGAADLASTFWHGEGICETEGDDLMRFVINEGQGFTAELHLAFDEQGRPADFFDGALDIQTDALFAEIPFSFGGGFGFTAMAPPMPKRALFTNDTFNLAYTRTVRFGAGEGNMQEGEVSTLSGELSADRLELTVDTHSSYWTDIVAPDESESFFEAKECRFTLRPEE